MAVKIVEAVFNYAQNANPGNLRAVNVLHFVANAPDVEVESVLPDIAATLGTLWGGCWAQCASEVLGYFSVLCQTVQGDLRSAGVISEAGQTPGNIVGEMLPLQNTVNLKKLTAYAGRAFRGRTYIPGVPVAAQVDGTITNDYRTTIEAAGWGSIFIQNIPCPAVNPVANLTMCVARAPWTVGPVTSPRVTQWQVDSVIRAQRRRQPGRGY